jgi:hypothetical protein
MMIGVPSHDVIVAVDWRSALCLTLCFLGRADAVAAVPRRRKARAKATIRDNGKLMAV